MAYILRLQLFKQLKFFMITRNHKPQPLVLSEKQASSSDEPTTLGLGDLVERVAQPIAKIIDKVAKTKIKECGGCKKRKEYLNKINLNIKK